MIVAHSLVMILTHSNSLGDIPRDIMALSSQSLHEHLLKLTNYVQNSWKNWWTESDRGHICKQIAMFEQELARRTLNAPHTVNAAGDLEEILSANE